jgi:hypothetical protein
MVSADQNVFDIMQGVSLIYLCKTGRKRWRIGKFSLWFIWKENLNMILSNNTLKQ